MLSTGFVLGTLALLLGAQNIGSPDAATNCPTSIIGPSTLTYPHTPKRPGFIVDVSQDDEKGQGADFPEDYLVLRVLSREWVSKVLAEMKFSSSYGRFELCVIDLTGDGIEEFALATGEGHGTNVRAETLTVWQRNGGSFKELLQVPVSAYFGHGQWWYRREFTDLNGDGKLDLRLVLEYDKPTSDPIGDPSSIPKIRVKEFVFDARKGRLLLHPARQ